MSHQQNLQEQFRQAMDEKPCGICGTKENRLIATCCGGITCHLCVLRCEVAGIMNCAFCREDLRGPGFIDVKNSYQIFKRTQTTIDNSGPNTERRQVKTRINQYIQEKLQPDSEE
jgi:hypothetical protein